jgi:hypothetical protein
VVPVLLRKDAQQDWQEQDCANFISQVCTHLPEGVALTPWHMLPAELWQGHQARLLCNDLNFHPFGRLNIMLLPADAHSSAALGLPQHPGSVTEDYVARGQKAVDRVAAQIEGLRLALTDASPETVKQAEIDFRTALAIADATILAAANMLADAQFGREVYKRHLRMFGSALGWAHARRLQ